MLPGIGVSCLREVGVESPCLLSFAGLFHTCVLTQICSWSLTLCHCLMSSDRYHTQKQLFFLHHPPPFLFPSPSPLFPPPLAHVPPSSCLCCLFKALMQLKLLPLELSLQPATERAWRKERKCRGVGREMVEGRDETQLHEIRPPVTVVSLQLVRFSK